MGRAGRRRARGGDRGAAALRFGGMQSALCLGRVAHALRGGHDHGRRESLPGPHRRGLPGHGPAGAAHLGAGHHAPRLGFAGRPRRAAALGRRRPALVARSRGPRLRRAAGAHPRRAPRSTPSASTGPAPASRTRPRPARRAGRGWSCASGTWGAGRRRTAARLSSYAVSQRPRLSPDGAVLAWEDLRRDGKRVVLAAGPASRAGRSSAGIAASSASPRTDASS